MNLGRVGGLLEAKKIAGMAETHYAQIAPHLYCGPIVGAANIQLAACSPNFLILESIQTWGGFHAQILKTPIRWEDGYVIPPTAPGLGVELDEAVAEAHPYTARSCTSRWWTGRCWSRCATASSASAISARHLAAQPASARGFPITVYDLDRAAAEPLLAAGAGWAATPRELAASRSTR